MEIDTTGFRTAVVFEKIQLESFLVKLFLLLVLLDAVFFVPMLPKFL